MHVENRGSESVNSAHPPCPSSHLPCAAVCQRWSAIAALGSSAVAGIWRLATGPEAQLAAREAVVLTSRLGLVKLDQAAPREELLTTAIRAAHGIALLLGAHLEGLARLGSDRCSRCWSRMAVVAAGDAPARNVFPGLPGNFVVALRPSEDELDDYLPLACVHGYPDW